MYSWIQNLNIRGSQFYWCVVGSYLRLVCLVIVYFNFFNIYSIYYRSSPVLIYWISIFVLSTCILTLFVKLFRIRVTDVVPFEKTISSCLKNILVQEVLMLKLFYEFFWFWILIMACHLLYQVNIICYFIQLNLFESMLESSWLFTIY